MSFVKSEDTLQELKQQISEKFAQKVQAEIDRLWEVGELNEEKVESFRNLHERTPYNEWTDATNVSNETTLEDIKEAVEQEEHAMNLSERNEAVEKLYSCIQLSDDFDYKAEKEKYLLEKYETKGIS